MSQARIDSLRKRRLQFVDLFRNRAQSIDVFCLITAAFLVVNDGLGNDGPGSAEVYDPQRGRWVATASPTRSRFGYTATRLSDGHVLVAGDYHPDRQATAEVYDPGGGS